MKNIELFEHKTDGGAVYLTDNHDFGIAKIIIRLDGKRPELTRCVTGEAEHSAMQSLDFTPLEVPAVSDNLFQAIGDVCRP
jgi:hypothetical protein